MTYLALACDYDGTLARDGRLDGPTRDSLDAWKRAGRRLLLVTGRELPQLRTICPHLSLFDLVVAENGALLFDPASGEECLLATPPPEVFPRTLRERGVDPLAVGRVVVATWQEHEATVRGAIADLGLPLEVILNKRDVMVLPVGVDKWSGLSTALARLGLEPSRVAAVGDAENDLQMLTRCGHGAAVANALPEVKRACRTVTRADHGAGVRELIDILLNPGGGEPS